MPDVHARMRLLAGMLVIVRVTTARAQSPAPTTSPDSLPIGARVQAVVSTDSRRIEGFVRAASADTIRVGDCKLCDPGTPIPVSTLRSLEVQRRRHRVRVGQVATDMLVGAFIGAIAGGGGGLVAGGVVGFSHHESYWIGVRLPPP